MADGVTSIPRAWGSVDDVGTVLATVIRRVQ
jgi:hypothetical protein